MQDVPPPTLLSRQRPRPAFASVLIASFSALASCTLAPPPVNHAGPAPTSGPVPTSTPTPEQAPAAAAQPATRFLIDPAASTVHILVYRGGTLARLGHNHVISSNQIHGEIWRGTTLRDSGFSLRVPVGDLIVDDEAARAAEGEDFPLNISEDARQGTTANMLRETLLDGAHYPEISLTSSSLGGSFDAPVVQVNLRIKDQTRLVTLPVTLTTTGDSLRARGRFDIRQSDFGITPLSVAMGALTVQDRITIKFDLLARRP